jgi:hypothetical protein
MGHHIGVDVVESESQKVSSSINFGGDGLLILIR